MTAQRTSLPEWRALGSHQATVRDRHLRDLFAEDPGRGERLVAEGAGLHLDYSKHRVTDETLRPLLALAEACDLGGTSTSSAFRHTSSSSRWSRRASV